MSSGAKQIDKKNDNLLYFIKDIFDLNSGERTSDVENVKRHIEHKGYSCVIKVIDVLADKWNIQIVFLVPKGAEFHRAELVKAVQNRFATKNVVELKKVKLIHAQHYVSNTSTSSQTFFDYYEDIS